MTSTPMAVQRRRFVVMGTDAELLLRAEEAVADERLAAAQMELVRLEGIFTRFDPTSPIEQLNDAGEGVVDGELRAVLEASLTAHRDTGGRVDVGIGADLIAAGYDRDFGMLDVPSDEEIIQAAREKDTAWTLMPHESAGREPPYTIDADGLVRLRPGVRIDLGGIAKGWSADHVAAMLADAGSCAVNLGGDLASRVAGGDPGWPIGVDLVSRTQSYDVMGGGLATSGQDTRVWRNEHASGEAGFAHHVIDPRTGQSAATDILRISVFGADCLEAEVWAKALFLQGCAAAREEADRVGIPAVIVGVDGAAHFTGGLEPQ